MERQNTRLMKELRLLQTELPREIVCSPKHESLDRYEARINGPVDSPYAGGRFFVEIVLPERYPIEPPSVKFKTRIYHPNIDDFGNICLDVLKSGKKGSWKPSWTLHKVLLALMTLMVTPNPQDPLMPDIAELMLSDHAAFVRAAHEWTVKHAMAHEDDPTEYVNGSQLSASSTKSPATDNKRKSPEPEESQQPSEEPTEAEPVKTRQRLGLSRKSASPGTDHPPPGLPPVHGKLPAAGGIRRLGLSRSKGTQAKQPLRLAKSPTPSSRLHSSSGSSQAESIEIASDDTGARESQISPSTKREPLRMARGRVGAKLSQLLSPQKKPRRPRAAKASRASSQSQSSEPQTVDSVSAATADSTDENELLPQQVSSDNDGPSMADTNDESINYDCLLSPEESAGEHVNSVEVSVSVAESVEPVSKSDQPVESRTAAMAPVDTEEELQDHVPVPAADSGPILESSQPPVAGGFAEPAHLQLSDGTYDVSSSGLSQEASSGGITIELGDIASEGEDAHPCIAIAADCSPPLQPSGMPKQLPSEGKGKAVDRSAPLAIGANPGGEAEGRVLLESHFGPLDLGLPPVRVSAQRKLMRRRRP
ncbi:Ubiquitin-conjugating enzyme E2 T [Coemansia sp. RSA 2611]|nr:Ubiquitin-conjugating enzyme E2 T [Coemansia sp. RSA 2611]